MKAIGIAALCAAALMTTAAMAQGDGSLPPGPKPAIKTSKDAPPAMPVPGKTSFTADQARDRMMQRGYNLTSNPLKDENGIWYAEGQKSDGASVMVMLDYQGNIYEGAAYAGHPSSAPGPEPTNNPPVKPISPQQK
jgi:hypothetical protein